MLNGNFILKAHLGQVDFLRDQYVRLKGNAILDYDQLLTIIKEIEIVLNNRPLTYFYTEIDSIEPVTPKIICLEETFSIKYRAFCCQNTRN